MKAPEIKASEYQNVINDNKVLIVVSSPTCGPCQKLKPILDEISEEGSVDGKIYKLDAGNSENRDLAIKLNVRSVPALIFYKNGEEVNRSVGFIGKNELVSKINSL